jgi:hypothetical protein
MLSSLLMYFLSLFPLPTGIARRLEHLQRDLFFFLDGIGGEPKLYFMNYNAVWSPVPKEGGGGGGV